MLQIDIFSDFTCDMQNTESIQGDRQLATTVKNTSRMLMSNFTGNVLGL